MNSGFAILYDLRAEDARRKARQHRSFWGLAHTNVCFLDDDHVLLTFRPAPDPRWRSWEAARKGLILGERAAVSARDG